MTLGCEDYFLRLLDQDEFIPVLAITIGSLVGMIAILAGTTSSICKTRAREHTKREMAAYVASGTIDADKAIAMLKAGEAGDLDQVC